MFCLLVSKPIIIILFLHLIIQYLLAMGNEFFLAHGFIFAFN